MIKKKIKRFGRRFRQEWFMPIGFFLFSIGCAGLVLTMADKMAYGVPTVLISVGVGFMVGGNKEI